MNIHLASDIHLEFGDVTLFGGDVLVLAGDVVEAKHAHQDKYRRFFDEELVKYDRVFYVLGNHEHYGNKFYKTADMMQAVLPDNTVLLDNGHEVYGGVLFVGSTLWTDANKDDPLTMHTLAGGMNDFKIITYKHNNAYYKFTPQAMVKEHRQSLKYFADTIAAHPDVPTVVVSHHGPTHLSVDPVFARDTLMNGGYVSDLSEFILDRPQIKAWCHGHVHNDVDYKVGECRVLTNPRGYKGYETIANNFETFFSFSV